MNNSQYPFSIESISIRNLNEKVPSDLDIIYQNSQEIHKHSVDQGYLILSKNDFGKVKKRINVGIFNKKTNFIVGEKKSLLVWDNEKEIISKPDTSEIIKNPSRYFLIYDLNFITKFNNNFLRITNKKTGEKIKLMLNKQFGKDIGIFLRKFEPDSTKISEEFEILKSIIFINEGKLSLNKQILINSNFEFLLGILEGYIGENIKFYLKSNINIYNITYILNLLGAQYSIRLIDENKKHIRFKLPIFLKNISNLQDIFFRNYKYIFEKENGKYVLKLKKDIVSLVPNPATVSFQEIVNSGMIELIPAKDLVFIKLEDKQQMYDLTMPNANATNFSLPGTPFLSNSDGDVLGVVAIHTKDAAEECIRKFSTELKENFLNLSTGNVSNWGVKLDAQMGLYSATT
jgi:hypothetical protein